MTENDVKILSDDPEARKVLDAAFLQMHRMLFKVALDEGTWGPANETLSQVRKKLAVESARISEKKRKK